MAETMDKLYENVQYERCFSVLLGFSVAMVGIFVYKVATSAVPKEEGEVFLGFANGSSDQDQQVLATASETTSAPAFKAKPVYDYDISESAFICPLYPTLDRREPVATCAPRLLPVTGLVGTAGLLQAPRLALPSVFGPTCPADAIRSINALPFSNATALPEVCLLIDRPPAFNLPLFILSFLAWMALYGIAFVVAFAILRCSRCVASWIMVSLRQAGRLAPASSNVKHQDTRALHATEGRDRFSAVYTWNAVLHTITVNITLSITIKDQAGRLAPASSTSTLVPIDPGSIPDDLSTLAERGIRNPTLATPAELWLAALAFIGAAQQTNHRCRELIAFYFAPVCLRTILPESGVAPICLRSLPKVAFGPPLPPETPASYQSAPFPAATATLHRPIQLPSDVNYMFHVRNYPSLSPHGWFVLYLPPSSFMSIFAPSIVRVAETEVPQYDLDPLQDHLEDLLANFVPNFAASSALQDSASPNPLDDNTNLQPSAPDAPSPDVLLDPSASTSEGSTAAQCSPVVSSPAGVPFIASGNDVEGAPLEPVSTSLVFGSVEFNSAQILPDLLCLQLRPNRHYGNKVARPMVDPTSGSPSMPAAPPLASASLTQTRDERPTIPTSERHQSVEQTGVKEIHLDARNSNPSGTVESQLGVLSGQLEAATSSETQPEDDVRRSEFAKEKQDFENSPSDGDEDGGEAGGRERDKRKELLVQGILNGGTQETEASLVHPNDVSAFTDVMNNSDMVTNSSMSLSTTTTSAEGKGKQRAREERSASATNEEAPGPSELETRSTSPDPTARFLQEASLFGEEEDDTSSSILPSVLWRETTEGLETNPEPIVLFVSKLHGAVTPSELQEALKVCGTCMPTLVGDSTGEFQNGTIEFSSYHNAQKAFAILRLRKIPCAALGSGPGVGARLLLSPYPDPDTIPPEPFSEPVEVRQIPRKVRIDDIFDIFRTCGPIYSIMKVAGTAQILFWSEKSALSAKIKVVEVLAAWKARRS